MFKKQFGLNSSRICFGFTHLIFLICNFIIWYCVYWYLELIICLYFYLCFYRDIKKFKIRLVLDFMKEYLILMFEKYWKWGDQSLKKKKNKNLFLYKSLHCYHFFVSFALKYFQLSLFLFDPFSLAIK